MTASVTHLRVSTPQPAPEPDPTACFTRTMADAFIAEGYRRACEEFGIPYFPPAQSRRLSVLGPAS